MIKGNHKTKDNKGLGRLHCYRVTVCLGAAEAVGLFCIS